MAYLPNGFILNNGTYHIIRVLGQGGFGITYLARDNNLNINVAIKEFFFKSCCIRDKRTQRVIISQQSEELVSQLRHKFLKEARNIARLNHYNIIRIFNAFEDNNTAYYAMEYVLGESIESKVKREGALSLSQANIYISQIGEALHYLHQNHMTHHDVKPANIMISETDNRAILIDFGLSKNYDNHGDPTTTNSLIGVSPGYSPIEQYGSNSDRGFCPQSDVYSLAATYYFMLHGVVPPEATNIEVENLNYPSSIPTTIRNVIRKGMATKIAHRHGSIKSFINDLLIATDVGNDATRIDISYHNEHEIHTPSTKSRSNENKHLYYIIGILFVTCCIMAIWAFKNNEVIDNPAESTSPPEQAINPPAATEEPYPPAATEEPYPSNEITTHNNPKLKSEITESDVLQKEPNVQDIISEKQVSEYGYFSDRDDLINFLNSFINEGYSNPLYIADNINIDYGSPKKFTKSQFMKIGEEHNTKNKIIASNHKLDESSITVSPLTKGGIKISFSQWYQRTQLKDNGNYTQQFSIKTVLSLNSNGKVFDIWERAKKLDSWWED